MLGVRIFTGVWNVSVYLVIRINFYVNIEFAYKKKKSCNALFCSTALHFIRTSPSLNMLNAANKSPPFSVAALTDRLDLYRLKGTVYNYS